MTAGGSPPSGSVTLSNGNQVLGTAALRRGVATFSTRELAAGTHTIKAVFDRNDNFKRAAKQLRQRVRN